VKSPERLDDVGGPGLNNSPVETVKKNKRKEMPKCRKHLRVILMPSRRRRLCIAFKPKKLKIKSMLRLRRRTSFMQKINR
jgi:hypothetical protein